MDRLALVLLLTAVVVPAFVLLWRLIRDVMKLRKQKTDIERLRAEIAQIDTMRHARRGG
jgi:cell division protein FtsB